VKKRNPINPPRHRLTTPRRVIINPCAPLVARNNPEKIPNPAAAKNIMIKTLSFFGGMYFIEIFHIL